MLDDERAELFIRATTELMAKCVMVDSKLEAYEREILQSIATRFGSLLGKLDADSALHKALQ